ncbi:hypothetical protein MPTK1_4g23140 [Marchantia polymorpha subsp. ruderalis]|uniref:START domain-containing protein n=2 Tax=Marchantia polymorpha TaxID=3197 RepID=A0A176W3D1_MARPO|nr:hypothetical protein AXG93_2225s1010 [Marchantia polymorpha subsp. ruderalis]PTQ44420.1 hypothetical protein MARPO_0020s0077 [Marchantia polymorpha]BBN09843.1 hypothetical protein Mp_4g23140 [Marchantia polymorpha subsp. ruderalis]|eukprot:PTQ44420.1 hypothetical protein MARPO_0020s0077 [Marchantia polymorpha]
MISGEEWVAKTAGSATWVALAIVICCYLLRLLIRSGVTFAVFSYKASAPTPERVPEVVNQVTITEEDLRKLIENLKGKDEVGESPWEPAFQKKTKTMSYVAKRRDPKDGGPTQYLSCTIFENVTSELVRDFYMDNDYRMIWDKAVKQSQQLEIDEATGVEIGRSVKKFPFFAPREYVQTWRVWEGNDKTFYCYIKKCEHKSFPRQRKFKRVETYNSGWRIRNVPGRNACEVTLIHQEDSVSGRELDKAGFGSGIWNFMVKMEKGLRLFALTSRTLHQSKNAVSLAQKVPTHLEEIMDESSSSDLSPLGESSLSCLTRTRSKRQLAKGLLLLGGAVVVMRGSSSVGARLAAACIVNRVIRPQNSLTSLLRRSPSKSL